MFIYNNESIQKETLMLFILFVYFILAFNRYNKICKPVMFVLLDKNTHNRLVIYMCIRYYGTVTNESSSCYKLT